MSAADNKRSWALAALLIPAATLLVFLALIVLSARGLSEKSGTAGSIILSDVTLQSGEGGHYLDARADIDLPDTIRAGLDSGVPLAFILDLTFLQARPFWFDKSLMRFQQRFTLTYYELTRHYRVHDQTTDSSRNFRSLSSALSGLGQFEGLSVPAPETTEVHAALTFKLDTRALPLQPLITSNWRLASEAYLWPVN